VEHAISSSSDVQMTQCLPLHSVSALSPRIIEAPLGRVIPDASWFGERLPEIPWVAAREAAKQCEVFLCCGTSALVQPAASLADIAIDAGATTVQVNPNPTALDASVTVVIRGPSGIVLPQLVSEAWGS
jgi:NAD-dependent SIR2 family protein deacetylase